MAPRGYHSVRAGGSETAAQINTAFLPCRGSTQHTRRSNALCTACLQMLVCPCETDWQMLHSLGRPRLVLKGAACRILAWFTILEPNILIHEYVNTSVYSWYKKSNLAYRYTRKYIQEENKEQGSCSQFVAIPSLHISMEARVDNPGCLTACSMFKANACVLE